MPMTWDSAVEQARLYMRGAPAIEAVALICAAALAAPPEGFDPTALVASISDEDIVRLSVAGPPFSLEYAMRQNLICGPWSWERDPDGTIRRFSFRPLLPVKHITLRFVSEEKP